jgi:hypothetical protein
MSTTDVSTMVASLESMSLERLNASAELLTRVDRKYVVTPETLGRVLGAHRPRLAALEIDGVRQFAYESVYFDTEGFDLFRAAATGRRRRFKVRTRLYVDAGTVMLEVKSKDGRGRTTKHRMERRVDDRDRLDEADRRFVGDVLASPGIADVMQPTLTTHYRRLTLVDQEDGGRITVDRDLRCVSPAGGELRLERLIVETKTDGSAGSFDRWLWRHGVRPERISKYSTAIAVLHPGLPANRWHRTLSRHFGA